MTTATLPSNLSSGAGITPQDLLASAEALRPTLGEGFRDEVVNSLYREAETIARRAVHQKGDRKYDLDQKIDRLVTSPIFGLPIMVVLLGVVFWVTIVAANVPSAMIANALFWFEDQMVALFNALGVP